MSDRMSAEEYRAPPVGLSCRWGAWDRTRNAYVNIAHTRLAEQANACHCGLWRRERGQWKDGYPMAFH